MEMDMIGLAQNVILGLLVVAVVYALIQEKKKNVPNNQLIAGLPAEMKANATEAWANVQPQLTQLEANIKPELQAIHERFDQLVKAASSKGQIQVGQTAFDQWDAIGPFWVTDREIILDGNSLRTGEQPPLTFKSQPATPKGNIPVLRES
jgi:hypothetical protein